MVTLEARHLSWFNDPSSILLQENNISRVFADPEVSPRQNENSNSLVSYFRLHGSPQIYYSNYKEKRLEEFSQKIKSCWDKGVETWCIFDNTARGFALSNAMIMQSLVLK